MRYNLHDAWLHWEENQTFPIGFIGDSTFAGLNTTDYFKNHSPNSFPYILEGLLNKNFKNKSVKIINRSFSGADCKDIITYLDDLLKNDLKTAKMVGIGLGINDRLKYSKLTDYKKGFYEDYESIIQYILNANKTPFIITSQATLEPQVLSKYESEYPLRKSSSIAIITNSVKKELADKYDLELVDIHKATERFLLYSKISLKDVISDQLHFGDVGHKFVAEYLYAYLSPYTIKLHDGQLITFQNQLIETSVPQDFLQFKDFGIFKCSINYSSNTSDNVLLFKVTTFKNHIGSLKLIFHKDTYDTPSAYILINGKKYLFNKNKTEVVIMEMGLYIIEVYSGNSDIKSFTGIQVDNA
ncbi:hypothetical protein VL4N_16790 [Vagococcus lutrae]|uniref:SGNH/GDSL hydrolase family protein n=1 Tax=Vagococcus lutrae TaxID=81947 RepID=UPI0019256A6E|nr:SGNH/GDSL hydrolase family protein [Vagococcus lutrae]GEQ62319.1 hypothetical protein VL2N_16550 [Vagococcus lutrae]GEQ64238.1 hypothetical protein VL3N_16800 [Vagococcus lutrae]GEQ66129.1 hypothetical protein VL4N_16790 [Vagococcus lutrae]